MGDQGKDSMCLLCHEGRLPLDRLILSAQYNNDAACRDRTMKQGSGATRDFGVESSFDL